MHLARPKSSKGRSRPAVDGLLRASGPHVDPKLPECHLRGKLDGSLRSRSEPEIRQACRWDKEGVLDLRQRAPASPPASLNRYQVLPSIRSRRSGGRPGKSLDEIMLQLSLPDGAGARSRRPEADRDDGQLRGEGPRPGSQEAAPATTKPGSLLLAIRAPCGRRFEQLFDPADTLRAVRASAEARFVATYREAFIETMDVPRRTFTDMDMTLARCGILNRSVLCISQNRDRIQQNIK
ncbi:UBX domain-containing protein 10 [Fundulus diaphanus]